MAAGCSGESIYGSYMCSNRAHGGTSSGLVEPVLPGAVRQRDDWGPGKIIVSWMLCDCPPALAAQTAGPAGHVAVCCAAVPALPVGLVQATARAAVVGCSSGQEACASH